MSELYFKSKSVDCLLTEIAFMGINHAMLAEVKIILDSLKYLTPNKGHVLVLEAFYLISIGNFKEAEFFFHEKLSISDIDNRDTLQVLHALNLKFLYNDLAMIKQVNSLLASGSLTNLEAIALAQNLLK